MDLNFFSNMTLKDSLLSPFYDFLNLLFLVTLQGTIILFPTYRWRNWGTKSLNDLPNITELGRSRAFIDFIATMNEKV